jgi:hypothetical protein
MRRQEYNLVPSYDEEEEMHGMNSDDEETAELHRKTYSDPRFNPPAPSRNSRIALLVFFFALCIAAYKSREHILFGI